MWEFKETLFHWLAIKGRCNKLILSYEKAKPFCCHFLIPFGTFPQELTSIWLLFKLKAGRPLLYVFFQYFLHFFFFFLFLKEKDGKTCLKAQKDFDEQTVCGLPVQFVDRNT